MITLTRNKAGGGRRILFALLSLLAGRRTLNFLKDFDQFLQRFFFFYRFMKTFINF